MTPDLRQAIDRTQTLVLNAQEWLRVTGDDDDIDWFIAAFSSASGFLSQLKILIDKGEVSEPTAATTVSDRHKIPKLEIAQGISDRLIELSRYVQTAIFQSTKDPDVQRLASLFVGNAYADVIWPLHYQYPEIVPEEMRTGSP